MDPTAIAQAVADYLDGVELGIDSFYAAVALPVSMWDPATDPQPEFLTIIPAGIPVITIGGEVEVEMGGASFALQTNVRRWTCGGVGEMATLTEHLTTPTYLGDEIRAGAHVTGEMPWVRQIHSQDGSVYFAMPLGLDARARAEVLALIAANPPGEVDLSGLAPANHNHNGTYAPVNHNHDDRYALADSGVGPMPVLTFYDRPLYAQAREQYLTDGFLQVGDQAYRIDTDEPDSVALPKWGAYMMAAKVTYGTETVLRLPTVAQFQAWLDAGEAQNRLIFAVNTKLDYAAAPTVMVVNAQAGETIVNGASDRVPDGTTATDSLTIRAGETVELALSDIGWMVVSRSQRDQFVAPVESAVAANGSATLSLGDGQRVFSVALTDDSVLSFSDSPGGDRPIEVTVHVSGAYTPTWVGVVWPTGGAPAYVNASLYRFVSLDNGVTWLGELVGAGYPG